MDIHNLFVYKFLIIAVWEEISLWGIRHFCFGFERKFSFRIFTKIPIFMIFVPKISNIRVNFAKETLEGVTKK